LPKYAKAWALRLANIPWGEVHDPPPIHHFSKIQTRKEKQKMAKKKNKVRGIKVVKTKRQVRCPECNAIVSSCVKKKRKKALLTCPNCGHVLKNGNKNMAHNEK